MKAMVMEASRVPLAYRDVGLPEIGINQLLLKVMFCGVCRTDLHIVDGELPNPKLPLIPGHEIIARVESAGSAVKGFSPGQHVGVPWLGYTCGKCRYCVNGHENLCENAGFTGYTIDGGYAEYTVADASYCFILDEHLANAASAPLLCAGLIGYRSYRMIEGHARNIGIYGFGAAAHIITQLAIAQKRKVFAFTRNGDEKSQEFALSIGAVWAR